MSDDIFEAPKSVKTKAAKKDPVAAAPKPDEWASPYKPKLNFMSDRHRGVEYGRRAVQNGFMLVLATVLALSGASIWADAYTVSLQRDLGAITQEVTIADDVLRQSEPITQFYANYVDQKDAVSHRFSDEISPSRLMTELGQLSGSSVKVNDVAYDLTDHSCLSSDPFQDVSGSGCISITGETSGASALAGFVDKVNSGSAMLSQARVTEARLQDGSMTFSLQAGYNSEAESHRGDQFTPTDEEIAKVVKSIPNRFDQGEQAASGQ